MKVAVLPIHFSDMARVTSHTRAQIASHFDAVKTYYEAQSGGREHLEHHVFDWLMLPMTGEQWKALFFQAGDTVVPMFAAGRSVDLSRFEHFVLLIDHVESHAGAWRPDDPSHRYLHLSAQDLSPALLAHELGHLAGADHGFLRTPFQDIQYGDTFCVMGGESEKYTFSDPLGPSGPGMSASMLHTCGWLDVNGPAAVDLGLGSRGEAVVELAPLQGAPAPNTPGRPVVAWSDGLAPDQRLLLEFRARQGWDRGLPACGSAPGWIVAHLTAGHGTAKSSTLIGAIGANSHATLELPDASVTLDVISADTNHVALKVVRRIRHLFSGDDGVIYAISDTGDLFWYRHDGRRDGSFRWADARPRKIASGWTFRQVFYGGDGVIYAVNDANDLLWFRHDGRSDGSFRWADLNPRKIGVGWQFKHLFSGGDGVIYAIDDANDLLWFRHDGRSDGSFRWADTNARKVGAGWAFKKVLSSGAADGVIYAVNQVDDLLWFRHDGRGDGSFRWADTNARKVGNEWRPRHLFSGGDGIIYMIDAANDLQWFRHDGRGDGSFRWADTNARKVGVGWNYKEPVDLGAAVIYGIDADKQLVWYQHDGHDDGAFRWRLDKARVVGAGWDVAHIFSGDGGVIYTIDRAGALRWYRHDGQVNGSFNWTDAPKRADGSQHCGIGWHMKHVFSGGDGIIYAINAAHELLWYRHDGRGDGSFKWVDNNARKVGVGWNVKHVFYGGDGVIYAINAANDLLWYRHDGRGDGSFKWVDNNARKVGVGWNVKHIFSGGKGVIYVIDAANDLLWYRHDGRGDGSFKWADNNARKVGVGWDFKQIFGG